MAIFVHLCAEDAIALIRRNGIRQTSRGTVARGVFAMPVTKDFQYTYQWVRELRQGRSGPMWGVQFKIDDAELVQFGHFRRPMVEVSAAEAVAQFSQNPEMGFQVLVPRRIHPREIKTVKRLPQVVGWRYFPEAKGRAPCGCPACQYGRFGGRKLRKAYEKQLN